MQKYFAFGQEGSFFNQAQQSYSKKNILDFGFDQILHGLKIRFDELFDAKLVKYRQAQLKHLFPRKTDVWNNFGQYTIILQCRKIFCKAASHSVRQENILYSSKIFCEAAQQS